MDVQRNGIFTELQIQAKFKFLIVNLISRRLIGPNDRLIGLAINAEVSVSFVNASLKWSFYCSSLPGY